MAVNGAGVKQFLVPAELFLKLFPVFPELHVELAGKFRESFGKPLVVITLPADAVPPPLVRAFVAAEEIGQSHLILDTQGVALRGIEKCEPAYIQKPWP